MVDHSFSAPDVKISMVPSTKMSGFSPPFPFFSKKKKIKIRIRKSKILTPSMRETLLSLYFILKGTLQDQNKEVIKQFPKHTADIVTLEEFLIAGGISSLDTQSLTTPDRR